MRFVCRLASLTALAALALAVASTDAEAQDTKSRISILLDNSGSMLQTPEIVEFPDACAPQFDPCVTSGSPPPDPDCNICVKERVVNDSFCANNFWDSFCRDDYAACYQSVTGNAGCGFMDGVFFDGIATRGDGSVENPGCDFDNDGLANDSRIYQAKEALATVAATFGEVEFALWRFAGVQGGGFCTSAGQCPTTPGGQNPFSCLGNQCVVNASLVGGECGFFTWTGADSGFDCDSCGGNLYSCLAFGLEESRTGGTSYLDGSTVTCLPPVSSPNITFSGPYDYGSGCDPLGGTRLVGFPASGFDDNFDDILAWINHDEGVDGQEIKATGGTPIAASLRDMRTSVLTDLSNDPSTPCRQYDVIVLTDGGESCEAVQDAVDAAAAFQNLAFTNPLGVNVTNYDVDVYVVGFAICPPNDPNCQTRQDLSDIAAAGGTTAIFVENQLELQAALAEIVSDSVLTELCNGLDDDCDGQTDEDFPGLGNGCSAGQGECLDNGTIVCNAAQDGVECTATPGSPSPEVCNNLDDDCNGLVDDGINCQGCIPQCLPADGCDVCNNIDEDCDGAIDEDFASEPCGIDIGACTPGGTSCSGGVVACDSPPAIGPEPEVCDGIDNDCDTVVDGISEPCYTGADGCTGDPQNGYVCDGICQPGTATCDDFPNPPVCVGDVTPVGEIACNNLDDDCDGDTDEGSGDEQCNGLDDDCDGAIDEEVAIFDPDIGAQCGTPPFDGVCQPGTVICAGGVEVCDGEIDPSPEICDNRDNDCNNMVDDDVPGFGGTCGTDVGECSEGTLLCQNGAPVCDGEVGPQPEVCNGLDDNCNGTTDETDPDLGTTCNELSGGGTVMTEDGECRFGVYICNSASGMLECVGAVGPEPELCNNLDDDCDTVVDEDFPELGTTCDNGEMGTCLIDGVYICTSDGSGTVCTAPPGVPGTEVCNGLDDDCDGPIDEDPLPQVGTECTPGIGLCDPGLWECNNGMLECGAPASGSPEVCNGEDDDCDGFIDETPPPLSGEGEDCVEPGFEQYGDIGECEFGTTQCINGGIDCFGYMGPQPEICNGVDDNCDGMVDNEAACPSEDDVCFMGECVSPCDTGEFPCPGGFVCRMLPEGNYCVENPCADVTCDPGFACNTDTGACEDLCEGVDCRAGEECRNGFCLDCFDLPSKCMEGQLCIADDMGVGQCEDNPCDPNPCDVGEVCQDGACLDDCSMGCPPGELCVGGMCEPDLCDEVECDGTRFCDPNSGECVNPNCNGVVCNPGEVCVDTSGECIPDPCLETECPEDNVCYVDPAGRAICDAPEPPPEDRVTAAGGGGCRTSEEGGAGALLLVFAGLLAIRRRGGPR